MTTATDSYHSALFEAPSDLTRDPLEVCANASRLQRRLRTILEAAQETLITTPADLHRRAFHHLRDALSGFWPPVRVDGHVISMAGVHLQWDGGWIAHRPALAGVVSEGVTEASGLEDVVEMLADAIEARVA